MDENGMNKIGTCKHISAEEFAKLDWSRYTLLDLREPDEVLVSGLEGAVNIPFSQGFAKMDTLPKDKPVIAFCRVGDWSEQVAEILSDRGYDAYSLEGGYNAYRDLTAPKVNQKSEDDVSNSEETLQSGVLCEESITPESKESVLHPEKGEKESEKEPDREVSTDPSEEESEKKADDIGGSVDPCEAGSAKREVKPAFLDAKGLKCPGPIVKVADYLREKPIGHTVVVEATEDAFASDIRVWCERTGNHLDSLKKKDGVIRARITRAETKKDKAGTVEEKHGKTFVIFSCDLDKTIAAFIMANGAAAMGRDVTMFFTFWGLNILRRPKKVRLKKTFVEKMFGAMMPRGTKKLKLSRMNMGGAGAVMIRKIMKKKGIHSLEELVRSARKHGVRLVACQMSMDIMGIHKEELIDGVELGGVSTFLGSGEESDMTLFI